MVKKLSAYKIYLLFSAITALCFSMIATVMIVYHIEKVHLNPLQLILVGTTLEAACFLFEIPTGIVADVYSRKLSRVTILSMNGQIKNYRNYSYKDFCKCGYSMYFTIGYAGIGFIYCFFNNG